MRMVQLLRQPAAGVLAHDRLRMPLAQEARMVAASAAASAKVGTDLYQLATSAAAAAVGIEEPVKEAATVEVLAAAERAALVALWEVPAAAA